GVWVGGMERERGGGGGGEASRARAAGRYARLEKLVARRGQQGDFNAVTLIRERADALAQRSAELKKLADAWQPLQASLDDGQKRRLRFLALFVLVEMSDRLDAGRMDYYAAYDDHDDQHYARSTLRHSPG